MESNPFEDTDDVNDPFGLRTFNQFGFDQIPTY